MREQDATLQYWSERINSLRSEYERAKSNTCLNIVGVCMTGQAQKNIARMDVF